MALLTNVVAALKGFISNLQIAMAYPGYERACRQATLAEAAQRFDTSSLQQESSALAARITAFAEQSFGEGIQRHRQEIARLTGLVRDTRESIVLFERNYKSELVELYEKKQRLHEEKQRLGDELTELQANHSAARESLDEAYQDLASARRSVSGWHSRSKRSTWLMGSAGRQLPKHSLFGQSFGDLDAAKRNRSSAASDICSAKQRVAGIRDELSRNKHRRDEVKAAIQRVREAIATTKAARQKMYDLRHQGVQLEFLRIALVEQTTQLSTEQESLQRAETQRSASIGQMEVDLGYRALTARIAAMDTEKQQFIAAFDMPSSQAARKMAHREQWRAKRRPSGR